MKDFSIMFLVNEWWLLPAVILISGITYLMYTKENMVDKCIPNMGYADVALLTVFNIVKSFDQSCDPINRKTIIAIVVDNSLSMMA